MNIILKIIALIPVIAIIVMGLGTLIVPILDENRLMKLRDEATKNREKL